MPSDGLRINIGVFTDEECKSLDSSKRVDNYLEDAEGIPYRLSHALLKKVYGDNYCIDCIEPSSKDEVEEGVCNKLYESSGKCETGNGSNYGEEESIMRENKRDEEELVCDFIDNLMSESFISEDMTIPIDDPREEGVESEDTDANVGAKEVGSSQFAIVATLAMLMCIFS